MSITFSYNKDFRFKAIKQELEAEFERHGYSLKNKFDSSVWFLAEDLELQKYVTDVQSYEMQIMQHFSKSLILQTILRIHSKTTNQLMHEMNHSPRELIAILLSLKIYVCDFIFNFTEILLHYQSLYEVSRETIEKHSIKSAVVEIKAELSKLEEDFIEPSSFKPSICFSVSRLQNFPKGRFSFKLVLVELDSENNLVQYERSFESGKKLKINERAMNLDLTSLNLNSSDVSFHQLFVHCINVERLRTKILKGDSMFLKVQLKEVEDSIFFEEKRSNRSKSKMIFSMDHYEDLRSPSSDHISTEIEKCSIASQSSTDLPFLQSNGVYSHIPIQFNYEENSGTNLYSYGISIQKDGEVFGETQDLFIDLFVGIAPKLIMNHSSTIKTTISTNISCKNHQVIADFDKLSPPKLDLAVHFEYSSSLRKCLLSRINSLYTKILDTCDFYKHQIYSSVNCSFPSSHERLIKYLNSRSTDEIEGCCNPNFCSIF